MAEDPRLTKEEAGYLHVGITGARCGNCTFFRLKHVLRAVGDCDEVKGEISAVWCCNGWWPEGEPLPENYTFAEGAAFTAALLAARAKRQRGS